MQVVDFLSSPEVSARPLGVLSCSSVTWGHLALPLTCIPTHLVTQQNKSPQVKNTTFILRKFGDHLFLLTYSLWELHLYPTTMPSSPQLTPHTIIPSLPALRGVLSMSVFSSLVTESFCQLSSDGNFILSVRRSQGRWYFREGGIFKREDVVKSSTEKMEKRKTMKRALGQSER